MNISLILAHPDPASFNSAIAGVCKDILQTNGHAVFFHDLYAEGFDPIITAEEISRSAKLAENLQMHCDEIAFADGIIIVHPNWWGQPPAILKGWIDRVFRPGVAYKFLEGDSGEGVPVGLLRAQSALIFNTSDTESSRESEVFGDPLERIWKDCIFGLCGVHDFYRKMFNIVISSAEEERKKWLCEVAETVNKFYPVNPEL